MLWHRRSISGINHGKYFSFHNGHKFTDVTVFDRPKGLCEIRGHAVGIVGIVIVRVAVRVDIAEIVRVVVIRGTLPPISGRASKRTDHRTERFSEIHPIYQYLRIIRLRLLGFLLEPFLITLDYLRNHLRFGIDQLT